MKQKSFIARTLSILFPFVICIFFPALGLAADDTTLNYTSASTDLSIRFLSNIFGVVDGVLHGSGSQIFGAMFGVFNSAVLALGTTVLGYTFFVSTLRTAHEGEVLGRNWSSIWIPFKSAAGFALMLPKATGYSLIQIAVMWIVVQGVGAANLLWSTVIDYLASGGTIIQPQTPSLKGSVTLASDILKAETCMFMIEQALSDEQKKNSEAQGTPLSSIPSFSQTITSPTKQNQKDFESKSGKKVIYFPGELTNPNGTPFMEGAFNHICGGVSWSSSDNPTFKRLNDARGIATLQVISDLLPYSQQIAKDYGPFPDAKQNSLSTMSPTALRDAANDYEGIVGPAVNAFQTFNLVQNNSFFQSAKAEGWIMAGSFYQDVVSINRNYATQETSYPTVQFTYPSADHPNLPTNIKNSDASLRTFFGKGASSPPSPLVQYINNQLAGTGTANVAAQVAAIQGYDVGSGVVSQLLTIFTGGLFTIIQGYIELWSNTGATGGLGMINPVISAAKVGSGLLTFVSSVWIGGAVAVFGITALASVCPAANPVGTAIQAAGNWFVPMVTALLLLAFTLGSTLAFYVPMIPYILFLFGGLGWIIGVIESIAAAPLVALGIAYPEEHEILGKAQPAVMLLANIFIRPSLMVIGFIAGISLSYVGIWLLNAGFARAASSMTTAASGAAGLFMPLALLTIYTALVIQILNQAFGLIHVIPDEVLRWVSGSPGKQFGEAQGEQAVRGAFKEDTGTFGKGYAETAASKKEKEDEQLGAQEKPSGGGLHVGSRNSGNNQSNPPSSS